MILGAIYVLGPLAVYAVLASLPKGRAAGIGLVIGAVVVAALWSMRIWRLPPLFTSDPEADGYGMLAVLIWTTSVGAAGLAQGLRWLLRMRPGIYAALAAAFFVGGAVAAARLLGF